MVGCLERASVTPVRSIPAGRLGAATLVALLCAAPACWWHRKPSAEAVVAAPAGEIALQVTNHNFLDVVVYVVHDGQRTRVGTVTEVFCGRARSSRIHDALPDSCVPVSVAFWSACAASATVSWVLIVVSFLPATTVSFTTTVSGLRRFSTVSLLSLSVSPTVRSEVRAPYLMLVCTVSVLPSQVRIILYGPDR